MYMKSQTMIRTQVYLSKEQEQALKSLALTSGTRQSELIREAIDLLLSNKNIMKGMWSDDKNSEQRMHSIREEFDRRK